MPDFIYDIYVIYDMHGALTYTLCIYVKASGMHSTTLDTYYTKMCVGLMSFINNTRIFCGWHTPNAKTGSIINTTINPSCISKFRKPLCLDFKKKQINLVNRTVH